MGEQQFFTKERLEDLKKELEDLKLKGRLEISERLKRAKELGDLSENSEYQEARESQSYLEKRIYDLEEMVKSAVIIKKNNNSKIKIGSTITIEKDNKKMKLTIVGANEAKPEEGFISNESLIGQALLGKEIGEIAKFKAPNGEMNYKIISIE